MSPSSLAFREIVDVVVDQDLRSRPRLPAAPGQYPQCYLPTQNFEKIRPKRSSVKVAPTTDTKRSTAIRNSALTTSSSAPDSKARHGSSKQFRPSSNAILCRSFVEPTQEIQVRREVMSEEVGPTWTDWRRLQYAGFLQGSPSPFPSQRRPFEEMCPSPSSPLTNQRITS